MRQIWKLKVWVTHYLNNTANFIKDFMYKYKLEVRKIINDFDIKNKLYKLIKLFIDTSITGLAIYYCIHYQNFFSYGLTSLLGLHYLKVIVSIIREKEKDNKWYYK